LSIDIDHQLVEALKKDIVFQKISNSISYQGNRLLRQAWVEYPAEKGSSIIKKWHPVLMKDQQTNTEGFEYNPGGGWQTKVKAGKKKIGLAEFISIIINKGYQNNHSVRSKVDAKGASQDARLVCGLKFDNELNALIQKYRSNSQLPNQITDSDFSIEEVNSVAQMNKEIEFAILGFKGEEKDVLAKYRLNQGKFRNIMLKYWSSSCAVSGLADERLLIASHILPWSQSTASQKGDPYNGLLLSIVWDALFDKGLISFDDKGQVILTRLTSEVIKTLGLDVEKSVIDPTKLTQEHKQYLFMHRLLHGFE